MKFRFLLRTVRPTQQFCKSALLRTVRPTCTPRRSILVCFVIFASFCTFAGIKFDNIDLNEHNELLFTVENITPGSFSYSSAFKTKINNPLDIEPLQILTCFPEQMELICSDSILQIHNRYGNFFYSLKDSSLVSENSVTSNSEVVSNDFNLSHSNNKVIALSKSATNKKNSIPLYAPKPTPIAVSPNGKWQCLVKKTSFVSGELLLQDTSTRKTYVLNTSSDFDYTNVPVKWSPDSSTLLYEKDGNICFANPEAIVKNIQIEEHFRTLCKGNINSVAFTRTQQLVFIDCDIVYCLNVSELYTLGLFSSFIGGSTAIARLPVFFNTERDSFFVNDDASKIVLIQDKKTISLYEINQKQFDYVDILYSKSYISSNSSILSMFVIWPAGKETNPTVQIELLSFLSNKKEYRLKKISESKETEVLNIKSPSCFAVNNTATQVAYYSENSVAVYDCINWNRIAVLPTEQVNCLAWNENNFLFVGGTEVVRLWNVLGNTFKTLFLASAKKVLWTEDSKTIQAQTSSGTIYRYNNALNVWNVDSENQMRNKNNIKNKDFRVYIDSSKNKKYDNALYARDLSGKAFTWPLIAETDEKLAEQKKVSIIIDALDSTSGLSQIINVLKSNNINSTFFINGEFIKRYPTETKQIALNAFECASMFYTNADLTASGFVIDEDFVRRGLARNEDEFFACTNKELLLFWHAPLYKSTQKIRQFGIKAGYSYVSSMGTNSDTIVLEDKTSEYKSANELIEAYLTLLQTGKPTKSVISVSTGVSHGSRTDYLYEKLDLLINLLLENGYELVPISKL